MAIPARVMAQAILLDCKDDLFDKDGLLSDECDDKIMEAVETMSPTELLELIWTAEFFDETLIDPSMSDGPKEMFRRLGLCCIRDAVKNDRLFRH